MIARGGTEMDILTSIRNRPIPTVIGAPIMMRRPVSRSGSERSSNGRACSKSSQIDNPQNHVYSVVEGARDSSSTEQGSTENVYATVKDDDIRSDQVTVDDRIYDIPDGDEDCDNLDCQIPSLEGDTSHDDGNVTANVYYSTPADNVQSETSSDDESKTDYCDDPYETVLFRN